MVNLLFVKYSYSYGFSENAPTSANLGGTGISDRVHALNTLSTASTVPVGNEVFLS
jgi:hypothetical protein